MRLGWLVFILFGSSLGAQPFETVFEALVQANFDLTLQKQRRDNVQIQTQPAYLFWLPQLSAKVEQGTSLLANPNPTTTVGFGLKYNLFRFGGDFYGWQRAKRQNEKEDSLFTWQQVVAEEESLRILFRILEFQKSLQLQQELLKLQKRIYETSQKRYQLGFVPLQDLQKSQLDYENFVFQVQEAELKLVREIKAIQVWLPDFKTLDTEWPWREHLKKIQGPVELSESWIDRHPYFVAQLKQFEEKDYQVSEQLSKLLPSLNATASYGQYREGQTGFAPYFDVGLQLQIPLWDNLGQWSEYRSSQKQREIADVTSLKVKRELRRDLEQAIAKLNLSLDQLKRIEELKRLTSALFEKSLEKFQRGLTSLNDYYVDQNRLLQSELNYLKTLANCHQSVADFCKAAGLPNAFCLPELTP